MEEDTPPRPVIQGQKGALLTLRTSLCSRTYPDPQVQRKLCGQGKDRLLFHLASKMTLHQPTI